VARTELDALASRSERVAAIERDAEAVIRDYAGLMPEALGALTPEDRHRVYKMLRLKVLVYPDGGGELSGVFGQGVSVGPSGITSGSSWRGTRVRIGGTTVAASRVEPNPVRKETRREREAWRAQREGTTTVRAGGRRLGAGRARRRQDHLAEPSERQPLPAVRRYNDGEGGAEPQDRRRARGPGVNLTWTSRFLVVMVAVFAGRVPRCKSPITKTPELRFHALLGNGGRELHLEWGTDKYLVEGVLSRVQ
jgi:hypothetical protein